jgi:serine protease
MKSPLIATLLLVVLAAAGSAPAVTVDPELERALKTQAGDEMIRVMMLMDDQLDLTNLEASLREATPAQRRRVVIEALQSHASASQAAALALLRAAESAGDARNVRSLWLANGIAFQGRGKIVAQLAALKVRATLVHDRPYDMISAVTGPQRSAAARTGSEEGLLKRSPAVPDTVWSVKWINANRVWLDTGYTGAGIVVGHFDTGAWLTHPDLVDRLWVNTGEIPGNGQDDDGNGYIDDVHGYDFAEDDGNPNDDVIGGGANHGTHTAGSVCGDGSAGTITGVAPGASVMVCKVYLSDGTGAPFSAVYEGMQYAAEMGARVLTMSLGVGGNISASAMRADRNATDALRAAGILLFNSAGNDRASFEPPYEIGVTARVPAPWNPLPGVPYSSLGGVCAVGGTSYKSDASYASSSMGPVNWGDVPPWYDWSYPPGLTKPDVSAPAVGINSLQKPSGYSGDTWNGTSMACPHGAGVAALMLEKNPSLSPAGIDSILEQTSVDLGVLGKDNVFGSGRMNALAAVNAVPTTLYPHLVTADVHMDAGGDGLFDPGETVNLTFVLANNSPVATATDVTATLTVGANPYVTVTDAVGSFGTIAMGGAIAENVANPFQLSCSGATPQGYVFTLYLTVSAQDGYQVTIDTPLFVGLPEYLTHDAGNVFLTVTDQGIIGYMDETQNEGDGFGSYVSGAGYLFLGSLWAGTGSTYICNRDYHGTGAGTETYEWVAMVTPNGRVKNLGAGRSDQDFRAIFSDAGHATAKNVIVRQYSYAWADPGHDDFVVLNYWIRNGGGETITDYHAGVFCDLDIDDYDTNQGGNDVNRHLTYMYGSSGTHVGIALLYPQNHKNLTLIHNPTYVYPNSAIDDAIKGRHLRGIMSTPASTGPDDWSILTSAGGVTLAPGDSVKFSFALVYGENLADLLANTDAAQERYAATPVFLSVFKLFERAGAVQIRWALESQAPDAEFRLTGQNGDASWDVPYGPGTAGAYEAVDSSSWLLAGETITYRLFFKSAASDWIELDRQQITLSVPELTTRLLDLHPNPFNPRLSIAYAVEKPQHVRLVVYDMTGQRVFTLIDERQGVGRREVVWTGQDSSGQRVASGTYIVRLEGEFGSDARKLMHVK